MSHQHQQSVPDWTHCPLIEKINSVMDIVPSLGRVEKSIHFNELLKDCMLSDYNIKKKFNDDFLNSDIGILFCKLLIVKIMLLMGVTTSRLRED